MPQLSYARPPGGLTKEDFTKILEGGFGDPMNNYAWSMAYFRGDLYVGTARNVPALVAQFVGIPPTGIPVTRPRGSLGDAEWAEDMTPQIWRYHCGTWEMVYEPELVVIGENVFPQTMGYRVMTTFTDKHGVEAIYAGVGIMSFAEPGQAPVLILRSDDGENWLPVNTTSIAGTDIRAMVVHEGKLYVSGMGGVIYSTDDPQTLPGGSDTWTPVCDPFFGDPTNTEIPELASFNGKLYAGTYNAENGFQVWRSTKTHPTSQADWVKIVDGGFGDTWSQGAITMEPFKGYLYVGSAIWLGYFPPIPGEGKGPKGFDLIRIDGNDNAELVVGSYFPRDPPPGWPTSRVPLSGWPAGFGNIANSYCWQLEEYNGYLYLGSFDWSVFLQYIPPERFASLFDEDNINAIIEELQEIEVPEEYEPYIQELLTILNEEDQTQLIEKLIACLVKYFGGGDLWKSPDGIHWYPVSLNGFDNPHNYGFRTVTSTPVGLFVGTANPFDGCEVWLAPGEVSPPCPSPPPSVPETSLTIPLASSIGAIVYLVLKKRREKFD